ncbi:MAG: DUF116 domain-containing protein [Syntrophorhabdales bacterium]|jgi:hypothetical protein
MTEKEVETKPNARDRRLGDEWLDWNGSTNPREVEIDEKVSTFLTLAAGAVLIFLACLQLGWYLTKPRIEQLSPLLSSLIGWAAFVLATIVIILIALETTLLLKFRRSLLPYVLAEKLLLSLLSKTIWLGQKLGISRDRVGNSFIKAHNLMVKSHARELNTETLLILLPRCLDKEMRRQAVERANGRAVQVVTAGGGEEARKAIRQYKPSLILAIACERDLISGIRDVAERIPVLAIPNKRPEGPCKNTHVQLDALDDALKFITAKTGKSDSA